MSSAHTDAPVLEPFEFGKYQILEEIGRGGMGVVYRARQRDLDRPVAIKMILASHLASPEQVERLHREAQAAARVSHPNVVSIFEAGSHNGQHYIAMEFVQGQSLAELLTTRTIELRATAGVVADVARAVHFLHEQGILHRDLKPSNILVADDGRPFVTDFGLAQMIGEGMTDSSASGVVVGTPGYLAPELAAGGANTASPQSDVYSLGAVLYEAATGGAPFAEASPIQTLINVLEKEPRPPRSIDPRIPLELETVVLKCLEKQPEERYPSAAELASDLEHWLTGEPIAAVPPAGWRRLRRWIRGHTALAARLVAFTVFFAVALVNTFVTRQIDTAFLGATALWLGVWSVASAVCEFLRSRMNNKERIHFVWATIDATLLTLILTEAKGPSSPLLLVYPLMVATSGFWLRVSLSIFMTTLVLFSYAALAIDAVLRRPEYAVTADRHLILCAVVILTGLVVGMQVRRARAISRYYARRLR